MGGHRLSLIPSANEHDRRTEGLQLFKMLVPIVNCTIEDRAKHLVAPDASVKLGNELSVVLLGKLLFHTVRSAERREGKECANTWRSWGSTYHYKQNKQQFRQ